MSTTFCSCFYCHGWLLCNIQDINKEKLWVLYFFVLQNMTSGRCWSLNFFVLSLLANFPSCKIWSKYEMMRLKSCSCHFLPPFPSSQMWSKIWFMGKNLVSKTFSSSHHCWGPFHLPINGLHLAHYERNKLINSKKVLNT